MSRHRRLILAAAILTPVLLGAQSGHWEGSINVPDNPIKVVLDVGKSATGGYVGTFSNARGDLKGLPLGGVTVAAKAIRMVLKVPDGAGTFVGTLSDDGKSITGTYDTDQDNYHIPFALIRTGEAQIDPAPKSAPIGKELEGAWNGTLSVNGVEKHLRITLANQSDGTSSGTLMSLDGAGVEIPIAIAQQGQSVTLDLKVTSAKYTGSLSADGSELVGTWSQGPLQFPLTFKRAPK